MPSRRGAPARTLLEEVSSRAEEQLATPRVGWLAPNSTPEALLVEWPGGPGSPRRARSVLALDVEQVATAVATRRPVVLLFENGDDALPLVVGLVQSSTPLLDAVLARSTGPAAQVEVDGRRRVLEAADEVVLRCGEASITLRRNGRVVIRGAQVETRARGTNRIKGGTVKIN